MNFQFKGIMFILSFLLILISIFLLLYWNLGGFVNLIKKLPPKEFDKISDLKLGILFFGVTILILIFIIYLISNPF